MGSLQDIPQCWKKIHLLDDRNLYLPSIEEARPIIIDNLHEEIRDAHPAMLRRFTLAAHAFPTEQDALAINAEMTKVRLFLGRLSGVQSVATMAFFEGFLREVYELSGGSCQGAGLARFGIC